MNLGESILDWLNENVMPWMIIALLLAFILFLIVLAIEAYKEASAPPRTHIMLDVGKWECSRTETTTYTQMMLVGKIMVPQVITQTECVEYKAKK